MKRYEKTSLADCCSGQKAERRKWYYYIYAGNKINYNKAGKRSIRIINVKGVTKNENNDKCVARNIDHMRHFAINEIINNIRIERKWQSYVMASKAKAPDAMSNSYRRYNPNNKGV